LEKGGSMRQKYSLLVLVLLLTNFVFATKTVLLPDVIKPDILKVDKKHLVIAEGASISIYSLEDFKLIKKFGKQGEGPQEFRLFPFGMGLDICLYPDYILINSIGKISFFTREGDFIKEKKIDTFRRMTSFQDKFVGTDMQFDKKLKGIKRGFNIYERKGEKIKKMCSHKLPILQGQGGGALLDLLSQINPEYQTSSDRIFVSGEQNFKIDIYDQGGNFLKSIKRDYKKQKLNPEDKKLMLDAYKNHPLYKSFWDDIHKAIKIPEYFPAFKTFQVADQKVYVQTFNKKQGKTGFLIFDLNGNYLKTVYIPLAYSDIVTPNLYSIYGGKVFQLNENEDEEWELCITKI